VAARERKEQAAAGGGKEQAVEGGIDPAEEERNRFGGSLAHKGGLSLDMAREGARLGSRPAVQQIC
jgi:hypothetical protein